MLYLALGKDTHESWDSQSKNVKFRETTIWSDVRRDNSMTTLSAKMCTLQWRHKELAGISNHQPHDFLLNRLFTRRSKKTSPWPVWGIHRWPANTPHKGPVTRKIFSLDDVIMSTEKGRHGVVYGLHKIQCLIQCLNLNGIMVLDSWIGNREFFFSTGSRNKKSTAVGTWQ